MRSVKRPTNIKLFVVLRSETFAKEIREMAERSYVAHRVSDSKTYAETVHCVEKLAAASFRLFAEKPKEEQTNILAQVAQLSENLNKDLGDQPPLIVALTLLTLLRAHEQLCNAPKARPAPLTRTNPITYRFCWTEHRGQAFFSSSPCFFSVTVLPTMLRVRMHLLPA
jgi:hypothetical protein